MATKSNIRSMRFSDEILGMIEDQPGDTFTAKFENLVRKCIKELPETEWRLKHLNQEIKERQTQLAKLREQYTRARTSLRSMEQKMEALDYEIIRALGEWEAAGA